MWASVCECCGEEGERVSERQQKKTYIISNHSTMPAAIWFYEFHRVSCFKAGSMGPEILFLISDKTISGSLLVMYGSEIQ